MVMGDRDKARSALTDARQAVANDAERLRQLNEGLKNLGLMDSMMPNERFDRATHDAQAAAFDDDRRFARGARGRGGAGAERDARLRSCFSRRRRWWPKSIFPPGKRFRLGGLVQPGSLVRGDNLAVTFKVADGSATLPVAYKGILPDLFREGQGVVAEGALDASGVFKADTVLAKHDETYMPKDVADALKKQGHWKDDYGAKPAAAQAQQAHAASQTGVFRSDRGSRTLRAGAGAGAGADPVHRADGRRALARSRLDECRALHRAGAIAVRRGLVRRAGHAARHFGFLRRQRVREFAFD